MFMLVLFFLYLFDIYVHTYINDKCELEMGLIRVQQAYDAQARLPDGDACQSPR